MKHSPPLMLVRRHPRSKVPVALAIALASITARAQPTGPVLYKSIEAKVAQAESVFRGSITGLTRTVVVPPNGYATNLLLSPDGKRRSAGTYQDPNGKVTYSLSVRVEEVLKGPGRQSVELAAEDRMAFDKRFEQWRDQQTPLLWFVGGTTTALTNGNGPQYGSVPSPGWRTIRLGKAVPAEALFYTDSDEFSMELARLTNAEAILGHAREFATQQRGPVQVHVFRNSPLLGCGVATYWHHLAVPVVPSLETLAKRMLQTPEDFFPRAIGPPATNAAHAKAEEAWLGSWRLSLQQDGLGALRYFKSEKNVALVRSFLNHPMESYSEINSAERIGTTVRQYPMRAAAYEVIKGWGVAVPEPILEEPVPPPDTKPAADIWSDDNSPASIAVDNRGNLYVANAGNSLLRKLTSVGTNWAVSVLGGTDGGEPTVRHEGRACSVAVDSSGSVYLADSFRCIVQKFNPVGTNWSAVTIAGRAGFKGMEDGPNSAARFENPSAICVDTSGNVFVADVSADTIRKVSPTGTNWVTTTIAGDPNKRGWWAVTNRADRLYRPQALTVDSRGNLFVANEGNYCIQKLTLAGAKWVMSTVVGGGDLGYAYADGIGGAARLQHPSALAADRGGSLYVAEANFGNSVIRRITLEGRGWAVRTIAGISPRDEEKNTVPFADGKNRHARFYFPGGLAVDGSGNIYVADTWNFAIRKLTHVGRDWVVTTVVRDIRQDP